VLILHFIFHFPGLGDSGAWLTEGCVLVGDCWGELLGYSLAANGRGVQVFSFLWGALRVGTRWGFVFPHLFCGGLVGPSCSCSSSLSFPLVKEGMGIWRVVVLRFGSARVFSRPALGLFCQLSAAVGMCWVGLL
jgi:hypothetical protein